VIGIAPPEAHAAGAVQLTVVVGGAEAQQSTSANTTFGYTARPSASWLVPESGPAGESSTLTVHGSSLAALSSAGLSCRFAGGGAGGGISATAALGIAGLTATCTPPPLPAGFVAVEVVASGQGGAAQGGLQFLFRPRASVTAVVGPADGALVMVGEVARTLELSNFTTVAVSTCRTRSIHV
jgi:hypothetical protein